jgi:hypothetical protein
MISKANQSPSNDPGNYIGGHSGIDPNTRRIIVAELRALAHSDELTNLAEKGNVIPFTSVYDWLIGRAREIEDAGPVGEIRRNLTQQGG